jgi:hypothetical protein
MTLRTRKVACVAAMSLTGAAVLAPSALAAPSKVNGGRTALTLTAAGKKALKKRHVKIAARAPGKAHGRTYTLPVKAGSYDFRTNRGTLTQRGSLRFKHGRRSIVISGLKVTLGAKSSKVVAKVGGRKMTIATLSRKTQKVRSSQANRSVNAIRFRLSRKAAKRINRKLGVKAVGAKRGFGRLSVRVHRPATSTGGANTGTGMANAPTSEAKIGFSPAVAQALAENGLAPSALPGAELLPDGGIALPVDIATIDPKTGTGTIDLIGGFTLGSGSNAVTIDKPQIVLTPSDQGLYASINGVRVKLADLDQSGLREAFQSGMTQVSSVLLSLSPEAAAQLNQLGGVSLFVPGTPIGDVSIALPSG